MILEKVRRNRTYSFGKDLYDRTMRDDVATARLFLLACDFPGLVFLITLLDSLTFKQKVCSTY